MPPEMEDMKFMVPKTSSSSKELLGYLNLA